MKVILLVSSSDSFVERNESLLSRSDFKIISAPDSVAALAIIRQQNVDLVLVDIKITDMSGEAFVATVIQAGLSCKPAVVLVCNDINDDCDRLKECGADALLGRPVKPLQLIKTVGQFLTVHLVRSRRVSLKIQVVSKKQEVDFFCISHNVSLTGMLIETEYFLEIGDVIVCSFAIPDSSQILAEGEIVRSDRTMGGGHLYGVHFTLISRQARHDLDQFISAIVRGNKSA